MKNNNLLFFILGALIGILCYFFISKCDTLISGKLNEYESGIHNQMKNLETIDDLEIKDISEQMNEEVDELKNCTHFNDGCNNCTKQENGIVTCTRKYCDPSETTKPRCLDNEYKEMNQQDDLKTKYENLLLGKKLEEIELIVSENNIESRIISIDGEGQIVTTDYNPERANLEITNGVVTTISLG